MIKKIESAKAEKSQEDFCAFSILATSWQNIYRKKPLPICGLSESSDEITGFMVAYRDPENICAVRLK